MLFWWKLHHCFSLLHILESSGELSKIPIPRLHPTPIESESLELGPENLPNTFARWFSIQQFEDHWDGLSEVFTDLAPQTPPTHPCPGTDARGMRAGPPNAAELMGFWGVRCFTSIVRDCLLCSECLCLPKFVHWNPNPQSRRWGFAQVLQFWGWGRLK